MFVLTDRDVAVIKRLARDGAAQDWSTDYSTWRMAWGLCWELVGMYYAKAVA